MLTDDKRLSQGLLKTEGKKNSSEDYFISINEKETIQKDNYPHK